jgi:hypothetical protein
MFDINETVRVVGQAKGSIDEFAIVKCVYPDGRIWIANLNSPFIGSISAIVQPSGIAKIV